MKNMIQNIYARLRQLSNRVTNLEEYSSYKAYQEVGGKCVKSQQQLPQARIAYYVNLQRTIPTTAEIFQGCLVQLDEEGYPLRRDWISCGATATHAGFYYLQKLSDSITGRTAKITDEHFNITIPLLQLEYEKLQWIIAGSTLYTTQKDAVMTIGGTRTKPPYFSVLVVVEYPHGIFHQYCIYKAYCRQSVVLEFRHNAPMEYDLECIGDLDTSRDIGDQLGYIYTQKYTLLSYPAVPLAEKLMNCPKIEDVATNKEQVISY